MKPMCDECRRNRYVCGHTPSPGGIRSGCAGYESYPEPVVIYPVWGKEPVTIYPVTSPFRRRGMT